MQWILLFALLAQDTKETFGVRQTPAAKELAVVKAQLDQANIQIAELHNSVRRLEQDKLAASQKVYEQFVPAIDVTGLAGLQSTKPRIQWIITTSPTCGPCHTFVNNVRERLPKFTVSGDDDAEFRVISITQKQWNDSGWTLPRVELFVEGRSVYVDIASKMTIDDMANRYNTEFNAARGTKEQNVVGVKVGTVPVKQQVQQLLNALGPFLDGGTITVSYTPKPGVIKEYLTIQQSSVAIRIPAKTTFTLGYDGRAASIKFQQPTVQVRIPIRGNINVNSMTLTPDKFAIQLPWMIDPEWAFSDSKVSMSMDDMPEMELAEAGLNDSKYNNLFGADRSGHWPTVRKHYNDTHPLCEACGSPYDGNVHHVQPFHINPALECDPTNLIRLCRDDHFNIGHLRNWKNSNPNVRQDSARKFESLKKQASNLPRDLNPFRDVPADSKITTRFERW